MKRRLNLVEPCVTEAQTLIDDLKARLATERHRRFVRLFTALAKDDKAIGLLAYFIWRTRARHYSRGQPHVTP